MQMQVYPRVCMIALYLSALKARRDFSINNENKVVPDFYSSFERNYVSSLSSYVCVWIGGLVIGVCIIDCMDDGGGCIFFGVVRWTR